MVSFKQVSEKSFLAEISDVKIQMDNYKERLAEEEQSKTDQEKAFKKRCVSLQNQLQALQTEKVRVLHILFVIIMYWLEFKSRYIITI